MATTNTVSSNFTGKEAGAIFGPAFKEADTLSKGLISVYENVDYKLNMRLQQLTDGTKAYACIEDGGFTAAADGSVTLSEKVLEPVKLMNLKQICKEDYRKTWSGDLMGGSASNPNAPRDIIEKIEQQELELLAERTDRVIWQGDNTNTNEWDGFIKLWKADTNVIKPAQETTPAPITPTNVLSEFAKVSNAIPVSLRRKNTTWIISPDVADAWTQYLVQQGAINGLGGNANTQLVYGRYALEVVNGLPDNTIAVFQKENLAFGTGLLADYNQIAFTDEDEKGLLTGNIRMKMVYSGAVQYAFSDEIVYYESVTP